LYAIIRYHSNAIIESTLKMISEAVSCSKLNVQGYLWKSRFYAISIYDEFFLKFSHLIHIAPSDFITTVIIGIQDEKDP